MAYKPPWQDVRPAIFEHALAVVAYRLLMDNDFRDKVLDLNNKTVNYNILQNKYGYTLVVDPNWGINDKQSLEDALAAINWDFSKINVADLEQSYFSHFNRKVPRWVRDFG